MTVLLQLCVSCEIKTQWQGSDQSRVRLVGQGTHQPCTVCNEANNSTMTANTTRLDADVPRTFQEPARTRKARRRSGRAGSFVLASAFVPVPVFVSVCVCESADRTQSDAGVDSCYVIADSFSTKGGTGTVFAATPDDCSRNISQPPRQQTII